jgi:tetratricopeptide (TPR) repeat protein
VTEVNTSISGSGWADLAAEAGNAADCGELAKAAVLYERALRVARSAADDDAAVLDLSGKLGDVYLETGETEDAIEIYKDALAISYTTQDALSLAVCQRRLGNAYLEAGEGERAADAFEEAETLHRRLEADDERALLFTSRGRLEEEQGHFNRALDAYRKALAIYQARGTAAGTVLCLRLIGSGLQQVGDLSGAAETLNRALQLIHSERSSDIPELVEVMNLLGSVLEDQGELTEARETFEEALELANRINLEPAQAVCLQRLASAHRSTGDLEKAVECLERAIQISRGLKDDVALSKLYGDLGDVYLERGAPEEAIKNLKEALYRDQTHRDVLGMAINHRRLGAAYQELGELERAKDSYDEAESYLQGLDDEGERSVLYTSRGSLFEDRGQYDRALAEYGRALAINEAQRNEAGTVICLRHLGSALLELGDVQTAGQHLERALVLLEARDGEDTPEVIAVSNLLGAVDEAQGRPEDALKRYRRSLDLAEGLDHKPLIAESLRRIASADCARGNHERGRERYQAAIHVLKELGDEVELASVYEDVGRSYEDQRQIDDAVRHYLAGLRIARRLTLPPELVRLGLGLARCYRQMHDLHRVSEVLEEIQEIVDIDSAAQRGEFWIECGRLAEDEEHHDNAAEYYEMALAVFKEQGHAEKALESQRLLLHAALARGDSDQAAEYLLEALSLSREDLRLAWGVMLAQLDSRIAAAALPAFKAGDDWSAMQKAFLVCEQLLRDRTGGSSRDQTAHLINEWFTPDKRGIEPWVDSDELDGFRQFCRGAFLSQRNPQAHRQMPIDMTEAAAWIAVTHLIASLTDPPIMSRQE